MNELKHRTLKDTSGFTLIDVTIALMVIGLLVAPLVQSYHLWQKDLEVENTRGELNNAQAAIDQFYFANDRYPCPADPTLVETDAMYGQEDCSGTNANIPVAPSGTDNVHIGMLPFVDLNIHPDDTLDSWKNRLQYAVTESLTNSATFAAGAITIGKDEIRQANDTCLAVADYSATNVHFALFSLGKSGAGAFNAQGNQIAACPAAGTTRDFENCDNDATFIYQECVGNEVAGAQFFDDLFVTDNNTLTAAPTTMWDPATDPNDVGLGGFSYVGINNSDPQAELDIIGNLRADNEISDPTKLGQAHASEFCDSSGANCFQAESIAGNDPNMACSGQQGMSGIASNSARCENAIPGATADSCPAGQYISSIAVGGVITCATP